MLRVIKCNIFSCVIILYFAHAIFSFSYILDKDILEISPKQIAFSSSFLYVIHIIQNENLFPVVMSSWFVTNMEWSIHVKNRLFPCEFHWSDVFILTLFNPYQNKPPLSQNWNLLLSLSSSHFTEHRGILRNFVRNLQLVIHGERGYCQSVCNEFPQQQLILSENSRASWFQ